MRRYDRTAKEKVRLQGFVREWTRAGLLEPIQGERLEKELRVDLRRTGRMLRAGLALFTALVIAASFGLALVLFDINGELAIGATAALAGVACAVAADTLAVRLLFYRHGVEEMLAVASCVLLSVAAYQLAHTEFGYSREPSALVVALTVAASSSYFVYRRFGFQYSAVGALACVALIPFQLSIGHPFERLLSIAVLMCAFFATGRIGRRHRGSIRGDDAVVVQAASLAGMYLATNLYLTGDILGLSPDLVAAWFKWTTYAMIWVLPAYGLWIGIRDRQRWLLDVGAAAALATLVTNKPYLGLVHRPWDPMLLGALLVAIALGVRRWLAHGADGERGGFTPERILASEDDLLRIARLASAGLDPRPTMPSGQPQVSGFEGGRSGGGGGGADF